MASTVTSHEMMLVIRIRKLSYIALMTCSPLRVSLSAQLFWIQSTESYETGLFTLTLLLIRGSHVRATPVSFSISLSRDAKALLRTRRA